MEPSYHISLVICTHNRADTLDKSLDYYKRISSVKPYEILIVANACTDHTLDIVKKHKEHNSKIRLVEEPKLGHSNARNCGWKNAQSRFVFYIDDDAYPSGNLVDELNLLLETNTIHCISGRTVYWNYNSPKWITPELVETPKYLSEFGKLPKGGYINGCACGFSLKALQACGGFNPKVGMMGKKTGYFDEVYVQEKLATLGYDIYFSPALRVYHQSHKKTVWEFLKAYYTQGKSSKQYKSTPYFSTIYHLVYASFSAMANLLPYTFKSGLKAGIVKSHSSFYYYLGRLIG